MKPKMIEAGRPIRVGDLSLTVLLEIESGKDRRVYKVKDQRGVFYAYKHAKKRAIKKEVARTELIQKLNESGACPAEGGIAYAKVIATGSDSAGHGAGYLVREWVQGTRGDDWLKSWESFGAPLQIEATDSLFLLLDASARAGLYIGKLDPEDMIFDGKRWVVVDCGGVRPMPPSDVAARYFWKMFERWGMKLDRHRPGSALANLLTLLSPLGKDYPLLIPTPVGTEPAPVDLIQKPVNPGVSRDSSGDIEEDEEEKEDGDDSSEDIDDDDDKNDPGASRDSMTEKAPGEAYSSGNIDDPDSPDEDPDNVDDSSDSIENPDSSPPPVPLSASQPTVVDPGVSRDPTKIGIG